MQTNREFHRLRAVLLTLGLGGCPAGAEDDLADASMTTSETSPSETGTGESDTNESDTSGTSPSDTGLGDTDTEDADCQHNDVWEPNASATHASAMGWDSVDEWTARRVIEPAYLCPGEGDWYHFDVASLGYTEHFMIVRALVEDAGLCGAECDQPVLKPGPEYAMTVEIFRAKDLLLLTSLTDDDGVLPLGGFGDEFSDQLLIHVHSLNPKAEYSYRLSVEIRNFDGEDECEC